MNRILFIENHQKTGLFFVDYLFVFQNYLKLNNIDNIISIQQKSKNITYCLRIYNRESYKLYNLLYTGSNVYMERKEILLRHASVMKYSKRGELLEAWNGNQQPSLSSNTFEGSQTNSRVLIRIVMLTRAPNTA